MPIKYVRLTVNIHGVEIADKASLGFLEGRIREATIACLRGNNKDAFNFRNLFEDDVEVIVEEYAGEAEIDSDGGG